MEMIDTISGALTMFQLVDKMTSACYWHLPGEAEGYCAFSRNLAFGGPCPSELINFEQAWHYSDTI